MYQATKVVEPNASPAVLKQLSMLSGKKGTFPEWQLKFIANSREKGTQEALLPISDGLNVAKTAAYFKSDNSIYNTIISSLSGDALFFATQKFSVKEDTPIDAYLSFITFIGR